MPHSDARHANRWFGKSKVNIVERLLNNMMRTEVYTGKKMKAYRVTKDAFDVIAERTKKNPVQVLVEALENAAPREEITRLQFGGISVPKAVDIAPSRRLDIALRNISKGAIQASFKTTKPIELCLADELILASKNDMNSFSVAKKEEVERVASRHAEQKGGIMGRKEDNIAKAQAIMRTPKYIRNIGTAAHIDHGKTTLSDNLIAGAGMMSENLAGKQLMLDYDEQEQARGITINAANASMVHTYGGHEYLINLIDTPGHVDFGGDVTRAMRALDGCIILVCAVEGIMPQTETVIRQALKERVRPVLFINKVDRLVNELKVTQQQMQERFVKIIAEVNKRITTQLPEDLRKSWQVKVEDGSVAFGSAYNNWAISAPYMKKSNISFKDVYEYCKNGDQKTLAKRSPVHEVLLDMVITHVPNPQDAQKVRIPVIWKGDLGTEVGKAMMNCDSNGPVTFMCTKIIMDPHAGEVAIGRLFSGKVTRGMELNIVGMGMNRCQTVSLSVGADRIPVDEVDAGNIVALAGLKDAFAGSTVSTAKDMEAFEKITHYSEPVVTVAIEAKHMKDLPKLVEVLRTVAKADPSIQVQINQETGENLLSGMGELHLDITQYRIVNDHKVEIKASAPIVVYRECVKGHGGPFEGKSPNKHNRFFMEVLPLEDTIVAAIKAGEIKTDGKIKDPKALAKQLSDLGMDKDQAKGDRGVQGQQRPHRHDQRYPEPARDDGTCASRLR